MEKASNQLKFISIIPNLVEGEGHIIPYHTAVTQAIQPLNWEHQVLIPRLVEPHLFPPHWQPCLYPCDLESKGHFFQQSFKIKESTKLGLSITKSLQFSSETTILFLERFIHLQLFALTLAIWLLPRQQCEQLNVWLLYRRDTHNSKTRWIYKSLNYLLKQKLPQGQFHLLTDSEKLKDSLSRYFKESIDVVPIPHTQLTPVNITYFSIDKEALICWWPGSPRLEKGWEIIKNLVDCDFSQGDKICLVAAETSALIANNQGIKLKLIQDKLDRQDYEQWLYSCDIVLLPYDREAYHERTSGIFTEAIIANKIPLVTPNTWMAYELAKYNLDQSLVLDWENPMTILDIILQLPQDSLIREKLKIMKDSYERFHNIKNYGNCLSKIYTFNK